MTPNFWAHCLHASESGGRSRPEAVRGMPERAVPLPGPQRQAVASSTRVDASSQDKPDGSSGGRAPGTGWAGLLTSGRKRDRAEKAGQVRYLQDGEFWIMVRRCHEQRGSLLVEWFFTS